MNMHTQLVSALAFALLLSAGASAANREAMELTVSLARDQHVVGQPLLVTLELRNVSQKEVIKPFIDNEDFADAEFTFTITPANGGTPVVQDFPSPADGSPPPSSQLRKMKPGDVLRTQAIILPRRKPEERFQPWELLPAGRCTLTAEVRGVESSPLELVLQPAEGEAAEAAKLMTDWPLTWFYRGGTRTPETVETLISRFPDTPAARLAGARLFLNDANRALHEAGMFPPEQAERTKVNNLIGTGRQWLDRNADSPLADDVLLRIARLQDDALKDEAAGRRTYQRIVNEHPDSSARPQAEESMNKPRGPK